MRKNNFLFRRLSSFTHARTFQPDFDLIVSISKRLYVVLNIPFTYQIHKWLSAITTICATLDDRNSQQLSFLQFGIQPTIMANLCFFFSTFMSGIIVRYHSICKDWCNNTIFTVFAKSSLAYVPACHV